MNASATPPPTPGWEETRTAHFLLRSEPNSYAGRMIDELAERAEAAYQQGSEWFGANTAPPLITLYLASWLDDVPRAGWVRVGNTLMATEADAALLTVSPEAPAVGLERAVLELHLRAALGAVPPRAGGVLRALGGYLASERGVGWDVEDADKQAAAQYA